MVFSAQEIKRVKGAAGSPFFATIWARLLAWVNAKDVEVSGGAGSPGADFHVDNSGGGSGVYGEAYAYAIVKLDDAGELTVTKLRFLRQWVESAAALPGGTVMSVVSAPQAGGLPLHQVDLDIGGDWFFGEETIAIPAAGVPVFFAVRLSVPTGEIVHCRVEIDLS